MAAQRLGVLAGLELEPWCWILERVAALAPVAALAYLARLRMAVEHSELVADLADLEWCCYRMERMALAWLESLLACLAVLESYRCWSRGRSVHLAAAALACLVG